MEKDIKDLSGKILVLEAILRSKDQQIDEILINIIDLGKASKKKSNLGFWLKLGGGGVWGEFMSPTGYQVLFLLFKHDLIAPKHEKGIKIKRL